MADPKTIRWGIIGAGDVCERKSGPPLYQLSNSSMELIYRRNRKAGLDFVNRHGHGEFADSIESLVNSDQIDAVYVASPHELHAEHTLLALNAGKPVMVEKPMATSTDDCDQMLACSLKNNLSLGVAYYRRAYPGIIKLRKLLKEGVIGSPTSASINNEFPTSHRLDLVHFLFGEIDSVCWFEGKRNAYRFESTVDQIQLETKIGVQVNMMLGWNETGLPESIYVQGENGSLYLSDLKQGKIILTNKHEEKLIQAGTIPYTHWGLFENFNEHLRTSIPLICNADEGRKSTVILDAIDSLKQPNVWSTIKYEKP